MTNIYMVTKIEVGHARNDFKSTGEVCLVADELRECHKDMDRKKAVGIDGITKEDYEAKLEENLENLERQLKQKYKKLYPDRPLPHITPHVFRHTFVQIWQMQEWTLKPCSMLWDILMWVSH